MCFAWLRISAWRTTRSWVEDIAGRPVLVIERYDRHETLNGLERIHQEDAGQAIGLPWGGNDKFENVNPAANLRAVAELLDVGRSALTRGPRQSERLRLLQYTVLNVACGNTDAHAKNFSLIHDNDGRTTLAPFYDAAPLALDFANGTALAMRVNGVSQLPDVTLDDLVTEAVEWGLDARLARTVVEETLEALIEATRTTHCSPSIEAHVPGYIRGQASNLLAGKAARILSAVPVNGPPAAGNATAFLAHAGHSTGGRCRRCQGRRDGGGRFDGHHADRHANVGARVRRVGTAPRGNADAGGREVHERGAFIGDR